MAAKKRKPAIQLGNRPKSRDESPMFYGNSDEERTQLRRAMEKVGYRDEREMWHRMADLDIAGHAAQSVRRSKANTARLAKQKMKRK